MTEDKSIWETIDEWLGKRSDLLTPSDVGREGVIISVDLKETKYGTKLLITIDFGTEKKVFFAGKRFAQSLVANVGSSQKLVGNKIRVINAKILTPKGQLKEKPVIELVK